MALKDLFTGTLQRGDTATSLQRTHQFRNYAIVAMAWAALLLLLVHPALSLLALLSAPVLLRARPAPVPVRVRSQTTLK